MYSSNSLSYSVYVAIATYRVISYLFVTQFRFSSARRYRDCSSHTYCGATTLHDDLLNTGASSYACFCTGFNGVINGGMRINTRIGLASEDIPETNLQ